MGERKSWFSDGVLRKEPKPEPLLPPPKMEVYMPEGINFDELWKDEEPETSGGMQLILSIVGIVVQFITLAILLFK